MLDGARLDMPKGRVERRLIFGGGDPDSGFLLGPKYLTYGHQKTAEKNSGIQGKIPTSAQILFSLRNPYWISLRNYR